MRMRTPSLAGRSFTRSGLLAVAGVVLAWGPASGTDRLASGHDRAPVESAATGRNAGKAGLTGTREALRVSVHDRVASVPTLPFRFAPAPHDDWRATSPTDGSRPRGALLPVSGAIHTAA